MIVAENLSITGSNGLATVEETIRLLFEELVAAGGEVGEGIPAASVGPRAGDEPSAGVSEFDRNALQRWFTSVLNAVAVTVDKHDPADTGRFQFTEVVLSQSLAPADRDA